MTSWILGYYNWSDSSTLNFKKMLLLLYKFSDNLKEVVYKKKKTGHPLNMSRKNMIKGILFLAIACMIFVAGQRKSNNIIQQNLKSNLIRFHVRANSNSRMDQTYKLKVRDAVIDQISPELSEAKTKEEAFKILKHSFPNHLFIKT